MKTDACREQRENLGAYALDQLPPDERAGLEAHLEGCPRCRAELEQLSALVRPMSLADPARFQSAPEGKLLGTDMYTTTYQKFGSMASPDIVII